MNIAIHCEQFDGRGSGKAPLDYGIALKSILGHNISFITSNKSKNEGITKLKENFNVFTYNYDHKPHNTSHINHEIESFIDTNKIDFIHMIKSGENDNIIPSNCKSGMHCVFNMTAPHGTVYAGVSKYLAKKFNKSLYVPHIIKNINPTINVREEMGISEDTIIIGRIGGVDSFDLPFVHEAIRQILELRKDIIFFFLSTTPFYYHDRIVYIPWVESEQEKFNIIHSCDIMLHGRCMGETFGLACGEFSVANKPIITWSGRGNPNYDKCHIELLDGKALLYNDGHDLVDILSNLNRKELKNNKWDTYSTKFDDVSVMNQYNNTFLNNNQ